MLTRAKSKNGNFYFVIPIGLLSFCLVAKGLFGFFFFHHSISVTQFPSLITHHFKIPYPFGTITYLLSLNIFHTVCESHTFCWWPFWKPKWKGEAQHHGQKRIGKWIENPLSPNGRNNESQAHEIKQMGLEEVNVLKGAWKERNKQTHEGKESKGLMAIPWTPRMMDNVIGLGKPKELRKRSWECKIKKRAEETQGKEMGQRSPRENKRDIEACQWCNKRTNGHTEPLGEE